MQIMLSFSVNFSKITWHWWWIQPERPINS